METQDQVNSPEASAPEAKATTPQKDAVYNLAVAALANVTRAEGQPLRELVTKEVRKSIRQGLFAAVKDGSVKLARPMDDSKLKKYCSSLINNWLKKDPRFN